MLESESNPYLKISFGCRRGKKFDGKKKEPLVRCSLLFGPDVSDSSSGIGRLFDCL